MLPDPTLDLRFDRGLVPHDLQFERASTATRVNAEGLIEVVDPHEPRIDYDPATGECKGLLIEPGRINLGVTDYANATSVGSIQTSVTTEMGVEAMNVQVTSGGWSRVDSFGPAITLTPATTSIMAWCGTGVRTGIMGRLTVALPSTPAVR